MSWIRSWTLSSHSQRVFLPTLLDAINKSSNFNQSLTKNTSFATSLQKWDRSKWDRVNMYLGKTTKFLKLHQALNSFARQQIQVRKLEKLYLPSLVETI